MPGSRPRLGEIWIAAAGACALAGCLDGGRDTSPGLHVPVASPGSPDPFPCTLSMQTGGPVAGQCAAAWHATDAGSVSNPVRIDVTMTGSTWLGGTAMPWSMHLSGIEDAPAQDLPLYLTVDVTLGAQASHAQNLLLTEVSFTTLTQRWEAPGVALHLTAQSIEDYAYGHFDMNGVHGAFDLTDPFVVHATF